MPKRTDSPFRVQSSSRPASSVPKNLEIEPPAFQGHASSPVKRAGSPVRRPISPIKSPAKMRKTRLPRNAQPPQWLTALQKMGPNQIWHYFSIGFSAVMVLIVFTILYDIFAIIRSDVRFRVEQQSASVLFDIEECRANYMANKCLPGQRVPAMNELCDQWELCMSRDPEKILHLKLLAEALNDTLRELLAPMGWNTLGFLVALFVGIPMLINWQRSAPNKEKIYVLR